MVTREQLSRAGAQVWGEGDIPCRQGNEASSPWALQMSVASSPVEHPRRLGGLLWDQSPRRT